MLQDDHSYPFSQFNHLGAQYCIKEKGYNSLKAKGILHLSKAEWRKIQQISLNNNDLGLYALYWLKVAKWQDYRSWNMYVCSNECKR